MALTDAQFHIVSENPLSLDKSLYEKSRDDLRTEDILGLLRALSSSEAAEKLCYPGNTDVVQDRLNHIRRTLASTDAAAGILNPFRDLINRVVNDSPDEVIWAAVFRLIDASPPPLPPSPSTPVPAPRFLANTFDATPCSISSNQLPYSADAGSVEAEIFQEVKGCTFREVEGFCKRFFPVNQWSKKRKQMFDRIMREHNGKRWKGFPRTPNEDPVWKWLCTLEERHLKGAANKLHTTGNSNPFSIFLTQKKKEAEATKADKFYYKDVLVIGEYKRSYDKSFKADFLQLARYVRNVFADQPTRRFIHAFSLCNSKMELWVFDRSGPYSSGVFDIHEEPSNFASALLTDKNGRRAKFVLDEAIVRQKAIVCRGTTCYTTKDGHVVKFSWRPTKRTSEADHYKLAAKRGVKGVAQLVAYYEVTTIQRIRKRLTFKERYKFWDDNLLSDNKRKSASDHKSSRSKRQQTAKSSLAKEVDDQLSISENKNPANPDLWENKSYSCLVIKPAGRIINNFKTPKELLNVLQDAIKAHRSLYLDGRILHRDISSNNIIITDQAKTGFHGMLIDLDLAEERNSKANGAQQIGTIQFMAIEVLQAVDHTYRHDLESFFYVLIWMCARQSWHNGFGGNMQETPTDGNSVLSKWEIGSFRDIALEKRSRMNGDTFGLILEEFPEALESVKGLCWAIRNILFPLFPTIHGHRVMSIGTPEGDPDKLYQPIIEAFDTAIQSL
ncbi:serine/threonine-protein kinase Sgk2 [Xylaria cubensis]|nr:serine/threonine-protein kinase Sgk2 [Xylaria cubensis]